MLCSAGDDLRVAEIERDGLGRVAAGAAYGEGVVVKDADYGVIDAGVDGAIVVEEEIGKGREAGGCVVIVDSDGLFTEVAAGHDEGNGFGGEALQGAEEERVEGRGWEHDAGGGVAGRDGGGERRDRLAAEEHDGSLGAEEGVAFARRDEAEALGGGDVRHHDGEWLLAAMLAGAKSDDGGLVAGVAGELVAAEGLDGGDFSGEEALGYVGEDGAGVCCGDAGDGRGEGELRAADGACVGLRVEAAVYGVLIFAAAGGTHGEAGHGGEGAVVRNVKNDAVAGAAVGAVGEGILVATVCGVEGVGEAGVADADVRGDEGEGALGGVAGEDDEFAVVTGRDGGGVALGDTGERWCFPGEGLQEGAECEGRAFNFDSDAGAGVEDVAGEVMAEGEVVNVGAEANSLDDAADGEAETGRSGRDRSDAGFCFQ